MSRGLGPWHESYGVGMKLPPAPSMDSLNYRNWDPMEQLRNEIKDLSGILAMERAVNSKPWRFFRWVCVLGLTIGVVLPAIIGVGTRFWTWAFS